MNPILEVKGVSKQFSISHFRTPYLTLRETLINLFKPTTSWEKFWALRGVTFDVFAGESIGIVGKNGCGKSTLLKILSRITPPTEGKVIIRGRISSLLEVGTGFHPELTGMENIFLNGSILGMKKQEIEKKMDDIIDFAQVEKFLDTPLKRYSSGMQLRLAFAISAFLEPEILVIDEVLAVGDAEFQKKCIKKMLEIRDSGRTILFVSHDLRAVEQLCEKSILLEDGKVKQYAPTREIINAYLNPETMPKAERVGEYVFSDREGGGISKISFLCNHQLAEVFYTDQPFEIRTFFTSTVPLAYPVLEVVIYNQQGTPMLGFGNQHYTGNLASNPVKRGTLIVKIPSLPLVEGHYQIDIHLCEGSKRLDSRVNVASLWVKSSPVADGLEPMDIRLNQFFVKDLVWSLEEAQ